MVGMDIYDHDVHIHVDVHVDDDVDDDDDDDDDKDSMIQWFNDDEESLDFRPPVDNPNLLPTKDSEALAEAAQKSIQRRLERRKSRAKEEFCQQKYRGLANIDSLTLHW